MPFSEEYLKDYENKIRKLPVDELYEILDTIRDHPLKADDSPERVQIVEKRIIELGGTIPVIRRNYWGHHPHGLDDVKELLDFHCRARD